MEEPFFEISDLPDPNKKLVILDLNGILIDRAYINDGFFLTHPLSATACTVGNFLIWKRPDLDNFLTFLFDYFNVAVWSSISRHNIISTAKFVFGEERFKKLVFVYDRDFCEVVHGTVSSRNQNIRGDHSTPKPVVRKNLTTVWNSFKDFDSSNTLIIDDSDEKMVNNPPCSVFNPGTWTRDMTNDTALTMNGKIFRRLLDFGTNVSSNVREVQPEISKEDRERFYDLWKVYVKEHNRKN